MAGCRACQSPIEPFIDFGRMPLANAFLTADEFGGEYFFNLSAAYCPRCTLVQLIDQPPRERMFNDRYPFFTASSVRMQEHFAAMARQVIKTLPPGDPFVVEIGSNDGTLLRQVRDAGISHLGVEPSRSVATVAQGLYRHNDLDGQTIYRPSKRPGKRSTGAATCSRSERCCTSV